MAKRFFVLMFMCFLILQVGTLQAEIQKSSASEKEEEAKRAEVNKLQDEAKANLNGSQWEVSIKPALNVSKSIFPQKDSLTFQNNQFWSADMSEEGFRPSNYTMTVPENEGLPIIWETMQTGEKGQVMFWRGEWNQEKNLMSGTIVRQLEKGNEDYYFSSTSIVKISPTSEKIDEEKLSEETVPSSSKLLGADEPTPTSDSDNKSKKGWF